MGRHVTLSPAMLRSSNVIDTALKVPRDKAKDAKQVHIYI